MEKLEKIKSLQSTTVDSSFEEEICEIGQESKEEKEKEIETKKFFQ